MFRRLAIAVCCTGAALVCAGAAAAAPAPPTKPLGGAAPATAPAPSTATILSQLAGGTVRASRADRNRRRALIAQLAARYPRLTDGQRTQAAPYLTRPTDGASDPGGHGYTVPEAPGSPSCTAHYCVHWVAASTDAPSLTDGNGNGIPDYVERVGAVAETSYSVENGTLGWRVPKSDGTAGGGAADHTDIYLAQLGGTGVYGYTSPDPGQRGNSLSSYLVIDNDFASGEYPNYASPELPLDVTLAHEYNHVIHFTYDALEDTWMFEATAVWMEDQVFTNINDYLQYLPGWVQLTTQPLTQFNGTNPSDRRNLKVYGSAVWTHWISSRFGPDVVRNSWDGSVQAKSFAPNAFGDAIKRAGGKGFSDEFGRFSAATAEWQAQNSGFPEGGSYPDVARIGSLSVDGVGGTARLDHTAYGLINLTGAGTKKLKLSVFTPKGTAGAIALVGRTGPPVGGTQVTALRELPSGGAGSVTLDNPAQFARVTAVLVNADIKNSGFDRTTGDWKFTKNAQAFSVFATTDFKAPKIKSVSANGKRVTVTFSEPVVGVTKSTLRLIGPNGRAVSASVSFKTGARTAKLTATRALAAGGHYRVRATTAVTDVALNKLSPLLRAFAAR
ncbi:MAG: hypothetical protein QOJ12_2010 [Thermoleophilales bacterium]|nr:hypothetical protein [Thermoleophilales bacterium]